jgi:NAD(P)-dependent dehydrogenase (short-subunit alcohol dehydrogenase family)
MAASTVVAAKVWRATRAIEFAGMTVVIVGGSRGLGLVMARELGAEGARVVLAARDEDELERAEHDLRDRGIAVTTIPCDVRQRTQVDAAIERVIREHGTIDVLVNDAGVIQVGPLEHMALGDFEEAMATNFWGPLFTVLAALPHMRRGGARRIVNIASIGGRIAVPHLLAYSASKFALAGLSEGLHAELAGSGFVVTTVSPGLMRTGSTYNAWFKGQQQREFAWFHILDSLPGLSIDATRAARQIIDACRHGDPEVTLTPAARLAVLLKAVSPGVVARAQVFGNSLLPSVSGPSGDEARSGWQSVSRVAPSPVTRLSDRATLENNQVPQSS